MARLFRAMVSLKHTNGLARDRVVNTFHIRTPDGVTAADIEGIAEDVREFYVSTTGYATPLMNYYSAAISGTGHEVRMYELNPTTGERIPYADAPPDHVELFDFVGAAVRATADTLPSEVAICLTMANVQSTNIPAARRRGRVFIGPFLKSVVSYSGDAARPGSAIRSALLGHGAALVSRLHTRVGAQDGLVVYSRPYAGRDEIVRPGRTTLPALPARPGTAYLVNQLSVDDAMDTVRKRGERATSRTTSSV